MADKVVSVQPWQRDFIPGRRVTPPCQGRMPHGLCHWPLTTYQYGLWLCHVCLSLHLTRRMLRRIAIYKARKKVRAQ